MNIEQARAYCRRMETARGSHEAMNRKTYVAAREISALVSIAEYGNADMARQAVKALQGIQ